MTEIDQTVHAPVRSTGMPAEALLRSDHTPRFERGGTVYATDGRVGALRHVVIDNVRGEIHALVVEVDKTSVQVLVPFQAVAKTGGSAVFLAGNRTQFAEWIEHAPRYQPERAIRVDYKALVRDQPKSGRDLQRAVKRAGRDYIEIGALS